MNIYQQQILDHYQNPRNYGKPEWNPSFTKKMENLSCGDIVTFFLKVEDDIISEISFEAEGCSISIAAASMLSEKVKGKNQSYIENMSFEDVLSDLGIELTPSRQKCALLSFEAVKQALN